MSGSTNRPPQFARYIASWLKLNVKCICVLGRRCTEHSDPRCLVPIPDQPSRINRDTAFEKFERVNPGCYRLEGIRMAGRELVGGGDIPPALAPNFRLIMSLIGHTKPAKMPARSPGRPRPYSRRAAKGRLILDAHQRQYAFINPKDNHAFLTEEFLRSLQAMPDRQRRRFYDGVYQSEIDGALWTFESIEHARCTPDDVPADLKRGRRRNRPIRHGR